MSELRQMIHALVLAATYMALSSIGKILTGDTWAMFLPFAPCKTPFLSDFGRSSPMRKTKTPVF